MKKITVLLIVSMISVVFAVPYGRSDNFKPYPATLKGKKFGIFLDNQFSIEEGFYTPLRLKEAGADVKVISHYEPTVYRENLHIKTDMTITEALNVQWDGIYIVGGFSPLEIREDKNAIRIIQDCNRRGALVGAICHGVTTLVTADIIRDKHITGVTARKKEFENAGAVYHEEAPIVDGNMITAIGSNDNGVIVDAMINWFDGGESAAKAHHSDQYLEGKKVAIVIDSRYEFTQVMYPHDRLTHNGADVFFVANTSGEYREYNNVRGPIKSDMDVRDAVNKEFDAVIICSHWAADTFRRHVDIQRFITSNLIKGTLVASMNWGHTILISADLCKGYEIATSWGMQNDIKNSGGTPVLKPVHRDRNLITCATDEDMPELMRYIVGYLTSMK